MGGNRFFNRTKAASMQEAYKKLVEYAEQEYGHQQGYSGEINCTGGVIDLTAEWKKTKLTHNQFIQKKEDGNLTKGNCYGICVTEPKTNKNKIKTQVDHVVEAGTKKWVLRYEVTSYDGYRKLFGTKGEAVKNARTYTEKTRISTQIEMKKVLEKGSTITAKISYKPSKDETPGEFVFFGIAPC